MAVPPRIGRDRNSEERGENAHREKKLKIEREVGERTRELREANRQLREEIAKCKESEKTLRESEERYRQHFESGPLGVYVSKPDGCLIACNPTFAKIFEFSSVEEAVRTNMNKIYIDSSSHESFLEKIKEKRTLERYESVMQSILGKRVHIIENVAGVFDKKGNLVEIRGYLTDITEQKNLESQFLHAVKMEAVGTLAGGVAHDFNNLLMAIQGNISLMLMDACVDIKHRNRMKNIERFIRRGAELTKQLLGFAQSGKYEVRICNPNELIRNSALMFGRTKKEISISMKLQENPRAVYIDRPQIEQALLDIFVNAWQAMPGGGKLFLATETNRLNEFEAEPCGVKPGEYVKITIADTGMGMDEKTRQRVFDPFFTTKEMGRGTGLGLASVYGIIKNHGGFINVQSEKGKGSAFVIYLPASKKHIKREDMLTDANKKRGKTVLFVDDEKIIIDVGREILEALGYNVLTADRGEDAIKAFETNHETVDLVILDMIMPDIGGGEIFDRLKKIDPHVKVLLASGYSIDGQATEIMERGCDGFIQKPFNMRDLSEKIMSILGP